MSVSYDDLDNLESQPTGSEVLGDDIYRWDSADGKHKITFGRPRGLSSLRVARILGPQQAANPVLDAYYKAVASIRTWNDEPFPEPSTELQFEFAFSRLGDDDLNAFTIAWQFSLYPEAIRSIQEANDAEELPEATPRKNSHAGSQRVTTSRRGRKAK